MSLSSIDPQHNESNPYSHLGSFAVSGSDLLCTPSDLPARICADLWKYTFNYAKVIQQPCTPSYLTAVWTVLLYSLRELLDSHGLTASVQNEFVYSVSKIFDIPLSEVEVLAALKALYKDVWRELIETNPNFYTIDCIMAASDLLCTFSNAKDQEEPVRATDKHTLTLINTFSELYSSVSSKVPCAKSPQPATPAVNRTTASAPRTASVPPVESTPSAPGISRRQFFVILFSLIAVIGFACIMANDSPTTTESQKAESVQAQSSNSGTNKPILAEKPRPASGTILEGKERVNASEITITADTDSDCVVALKNDLGVTLIAFYVRSGDTVTVGVPNAEMYVYFASGDKWYGYKKGYMFGEYTGYGKDDDLLDFAQYTYTYTLRPVTNGNFQETPANEDDFF